MTTNEIETVLQLAQQCGLERPEYIGDLRILPELKSVPRSLIVQSAEWVEGRKAFRYSMHVGNTNWSPIAPAREAMRLGAFYVNNPYAKKTELTMFNVGTNTLKLSLGQDIPMEIADAIVGKLARRDVRFSNATVRSEWDQENLDVSKAAALSWFRKDNFTECTSEVRSSW